MVQGHINDKAANLLIDTGASRTVFDLSRISNFIAQENFEAHDSLTTGLGTDSMQGHSVEIPHLKVGDLEIVNYSAFLLDLSHVNGTYDKMGMDAIDGVIGSDLLVRHKAVIDYPKKILSLSTTSPKT